jgi:hypothetical protein
VKLFDFKNVLQHIHFVAIAIKLVKKIICDAFEILLSTQLFQYSGGSTYKPVAASSPKRFDFCFLQRLL